MGRDGGGSSNAVNVMQSMWPKDMCSFCACDEFFLFFEV